MNQPTTIDLELQLATNLFGKLDRTVRARLLRYLDSPSAETWADVQSIILDRHSWTTVWQAWIATDENAARVGRSTDCHGKVMREWSHWPTTEQFVRAVKYATH